MELWRSLEEIENDPAFEEMLHREFPGGASAWAELQDPVSRRSFIKLMSASFALAGITACTRMPAEKIIPYVVAPEELTPGLPQFYASTFTLGGFAQGVLVESHEGRPTKIEGNPLHPASLGRSDVFMQGALLSLYDPDRAKSVLHLGLPSTWDQFDAAMRAQAAVWAASQGDGVRILTERVTSPTLAWQIQSFLKRYPKARWHSYEPVHGDLRKEASELVFGRDLRPVYRFERARVVVSLDGDFLGPGPAQIAHAQAFAKGRDPLRDPNRLYVAESAVTNTGACADHRLPLRPTQIRDVALALARAVGVGGLPAVASALDPRLTRWVQAAAQDLTSHAGDSVVVAGEQSEATVQALALAINDKLGNAGRTIDLIPPPEARPEALEDSLSGLIQDMNRSRVGALLIFGANPVYASPAGSGFADALKKVALRVRHGLYEDETSFHCHWQLPEAHFLECWGDARAFDGTVSLQQPLIAPIYEGRAPIEVMAALNGQSGSTSYQILKNYWRTQVTHDGGFDGFFEKSVHDGLIAGSAFRPVQARPKPGWTSRLPARTEPGPQGTLEVTIHPDATIWDGRFANNAWLQELPKPLLQLTWDNAAILSPATAKRLGVKDEDLVEISLGERTVKAPVLRVPGQPDDVIALTLGYGRWRAGNTGSNRGFNAYQLLERKIPAFAAGASIRPAGFKLALAVVHAHHSMEGRDLVRRGTVSDFKADPEKIVPGEARKAPPSLLSEYPSENQEAWAMVIDLNRCIGCKACTIACQAENNIPVVGKEEVRRSREMHWIRVDRYFEGPASNPQMYFQPVPCMHCEQAPCEYVCPTLATVHSSDGLNQMIYNRCVGTRYCSNNCPYKVRRFNFFQYADTKTSTYKLMHNPDVTVRSRGVMEKCTYCVQRIQEKRIDAEKENRKIRDGEVMTACQQACPADAILFGDKNDPQARVTKARALSFQYALLNELGTRPRTTYLARLRNPNPSLEGGAE